jgi:UDP-glucose 4-epimerase
VTRLRRFLKRIRRRNVRVLFTGSSGAKVGATVAAHIAKSQEVIGVDRLASTTTQHLADITKGTDWPRLLDGVDAVIHFAALHAPHRETHSEAEFVATNVEATARLLDAAKAAGVRRFVMASTTSVYGRAMKGKTSAVWVTESLSPEPEDIYDETKLAAEALCADAFAPDFVTMALRFSRCFAEPVREMALYRLYRGVDAQDVAQAFALAIESGPRAPRNTAPIGEFEAFNISAPSPFQREDCDDLMGDAASVIRLRAPELAEEFSRRNWPLPQSIDRVYVIEKAKAQWGFAPLGDYRAFLQTLPP